jgi:hypothetical protein
VSKESWPKYLVRLAKSALVVRFASTAPESIEGQAQRLRMMGLGEGDKMGYVSILRKGLERAAWLSEHGEREQRRLAAEFVEYILRRAWETGKEDYEKAKEIVEEGMLRDSLTLKGFEGVVEVGGRRHMVKVIGGGAELEEGRGGKSHLRIKITAEVDGVVRDYTTTYGRYGKHNAALGFAYARADAPGGEADAERFAAVIKALTGEEPKVYRMKNGKIKIACYEGHLEGFARCAELTDTIASWTEETRRQ